jgi:hypothetical protein
MSLGRGQVFAGYTIVRLLGSGGEGAKWNFRGLSLEQKRALLMWLHKELAVMNAGDLLDHLTTVARIRAMSAVEVGRQAKVEELKAAVVQRRAAEEATEYGTTEA